MSEVAKKFTGFKFIDEKLDGLLADKLCCIGGENDPTTENNFAFQS